jgi:hypothetical protein
MTLITSIRGPLAAPDHAPSPSAEPRRSARAPSGTSAPVAVPDLVQALRQPNRTASAAPPQFLTAPTTVETSAAEAAEAARAAYILASIAAGISPLPLP